MAKPAAKRARRYYKRGVLFEDDDLLHEILEFVPGKSYRYLGLVSKKFLKNYLKIHGNDRETSIGLALQSVSTAKIWVQENPNERLKICACKNAAREGNLDVLMYLRSEGFGGISGVFVAAASQGHLHVLRWAHENGYRWYSSPEICRVAALNGHLHVLKWARQNGCDWTSTTCMEAARNGHLHVLQWARENGCGWNSFTCSAAAGNGHLRVLQWARENGCDCDLVFCLFVARRFPNVVAWIQENQR